MSHHAVSIGKRVQTDSPYFQISLQPRSFACIKRYLTWRVVVCILVYFFPFVSIFLPDDHFMVIAARGQDIAIHRVSPCHLPNLKYTYSVDTSIMKISKGGDYHIAVSQYFITVNVFQILDIQWNVFISLLYWYHIYFLNCKTIDNTNIFTPELGFFSPFSLETYHNIINIAIGNRGIFIYQISYRKIICNFHLCCSWHIYGGERFKLV